MFLHVHVGSAARPQYTDFNGNGENETDEKQWWTHGYPTADQQHAAEAWFLRRLLDGAIAQPQLNASDQLFVAGFVKTRAFSLWLGDGQNAAGTLEYRLAPNHKTFALQVLSNDKKVTGRLEVDTRDMAGRQIDVLLEGAQVDHFEGGGFYVYKNLGNSQTLTLTIDPQPPTPVLP